MKLYIVYITTLTAPPAWMLGQMPCFAEPQKNVRLQWEKRQSFLSKKRKVPGKGGTMGKEQRCAEGIWVCDYVRSM